ncbi:hypothetical protein G6F57_015418 [Rhizopus arrhizus]|nr:hypothetical protein G6F57_015418 [Rhizopus arrhizus]
MGFRRPHVVRDPAAGQPGTELGVARAFRAAAAAAGSVRAGPGQCARWPGPAVAEQQPGGVVSGWRRRRAAGPVRAGAGRGTRQPGRGAGAGTGIAGLCRGHAGREWTAPAGAAATRPGEAGPGAAAVAWAGLHAGTGDRPVSVTVPLPYAWVRSHGVMLAEAGGEPVLLGTAETAAWAVAELRRRHGPLPFQALEAAAWQQRLGEQYRDGGDAAAVVGAAESEVDLDRLMQDMPEVTDLLDAQDDAPVIRMINALLAQAARDGASDLHIEPFETHSVVRYRVDGTLRDMVQPRRALHAALVSRIKIMAHLDIAEKRLPQDGRIAIRVGGRPLDIRVSTVPTGHGERAVLRLLEKDAGRLQLQRLGMADDTLATFTGLIRQPHGIVLVTGPTGSGKTTSLSMRASA